MPSDLAYLPPQERYVATVLAREDLYFFSRWMFLQRNGYKWLQSEHHQLICNKLMQVYRGEVKRLIINVPPRYSKTELAVRNFMAWTLGREPDAEFIHASYSAPLAVNNAWDVREIVMNDAYGEIFPELTIRADSSAKAHWKTIQGGVVYAAGAGGTITGFGAGKRSREGFGGAIIIDDPHKADEGRSPTIRQGVIDWFQGTIESRKNSPNTPIIVIMQRLDMRDLSGFLIGGGNGEKWDQLILPAILDQGTKHERALWPASHDLETLKVMQKAAPYTFSGQYQQTPTVTGGNIFKPDNIGVLDMEPADVITWVRGWDFAASIPRPGVAPDWTAGLRLGQRRNGKFVVADCTRMQGLPDAVETTLVNTSARDGKRTIVDLPQDPGQAGKSQIAYFVKKLMGYRVKASPESGDKIQRAEPFAAQVNVGNVDMVRGKWNDAFIDELRNFPNGINDDMVDASSRAFNRLTEGRKPLFISPNLARRA